MSTLTEPPVITARERRRLRRRLPDMSAQMNPRWRFDRAARLVSLDARRFSRRDDVRIVTLAKMLRLYQGIDPEGPDAAEQKYPEYCWAHVIHTEESRGPRAPLEALVLLDYPMEKTAAYLDLPLPVVQTYEDCYFDVRRFVRRSEAWRPLLYGRLLSRGLRDGDPDVLWKQLALTCGADVLLKLWSGQTPGPEELAVLDRCITAQKRRGALISEHLRPLRPGDANDVFNEYLTLRRLELDQRRLDAELPGAEGGAQEILSGLYRSIQFTLYSRKAPESGRGDGSAVAEVVQRLQSVTERNDVSHQIGVRGGTGAP